MSDATQKFVMRLEAQGAQAAKAELTGVSGEVRKVAAAVDELAAKAKGGGASAQLLGDELVQAGHEGGAAMEALRIKLDVSCCLFRGQQVKLA